MPLINHGQLYTTTVGTTRPQAPERPVGEVLSSVWTLVHMTGVPSNDLGALPAGPTRLAFCWSRSLDVPDWFSRRDFGILVDLYLRLAIEYPTRSLDVVGGLPGDQQFQDLSIRLSSGQFLHVYHYLQTNIFHSPNTFECFLSRSTAEDERGSTYSVSFDHVLGKARSLLNEIPLKPVW